MAEKSAKVEVKNVNHPGAVSRVNEAKYHAMREALLQILPTQEPGMTQAEMVASVKPELPDDLFPGGATATWWLKTVQLDLEAKALMRRIKGKPLRWVRC